MGWTFTDDPEVFATTTLPLLMAEPVSNTVALTVLDSLRVGHRYSEQPVTLAWYGERGEVTGAVLRTPQFGLLLARLPAGSEDGLVEQLRARGIAVPDANGTAEAVRRFSSCWIAGTDLSTEPVFQHRLFRLEQLVPPAPMPAGSARLARRTDLDLVMDWMHAFHEEAEPRAGAPSRAMYERRIEEELTWLWLDPEGRTVSTASRNVTIAGVSRVGPVYTPPEHRQHGYAAGVTAVCTRHALDTGGEQVVLFTDRANPTSNGIYQRLGYRPIEDRLVLRYR